jgi:hypothetical protein
VTLLDREVVIRYWAAAGLVILAILIAFAVGDEVGEASHRTPANEHGPIRGA